MAGKTTFLSDALLNHVLRATDYAEPTTVYAGLFTAAPTDAGGGTEVSGNAYARQAITFGAPAAGTGRRVTNSADVTFPVASGSWGSVTHMGIFDALTTGNLLYWAAVTTAKTIALNDQARFPSGQLIVDED